MNSKNAKVFFAAMSLIAVILACGGQPSSSLTEVPAATEAATKVDAGSPPTEIAIQHQVIPASLPVQRSSHAGDYDSSTTAAEKTSAGGDRFTFERFERPFNANTMDVYFSQLDIVDTYVFQDALWVYGTITLKAPDASNALSGKYALELDVDLDSKGDWLILVSNPSSTDWSVDGVQVYEDTNNDVGGELAMLSDKDVAGGNGFEILAFDQGHGSDPDTAWARISTTTPNTIEFAVKRSILGNPEKYLINMWAGTSLLDPSLFDISDHFTHEQAGAGDSKLEFFYPIKAVSEIDNSCRMAVGFQPTGQEAGLCDVFIPSEPGASIPGPSGCQATQREIIACNAQAEYTWNSSSCQCEYTGPN